MNVRQKFDELNINLEYYLESSPISAKTNLLLLYVESLVILLEDNPYKSYMYSNLNTIKWELHRQLTKLMLLITLRSNYRKISICTSLIILFPFHNQNTVVFGMSLKMMKNVLML